MVASFKGGMFSRNKHPPAQLEVGRSLAPHRELVVMKKSKSLTEQTTNCLIPELSNLRVLRQSRGYPDAITRSTLCIVLPA